tara:strand:+ start:327 stop:728 length:402 start_codon:yes stop_codon:yes gene_type:complete
VIGVYLNLNFKKTFLPCCNKEGRYMSCRLKSKLIFIVGGILLSGCVFAQQDAQQTEEVQALPLPQWVVDMKSQIPANVQLLEFEKINDYKSMMKFRVEGQRKMIFFMDQLRRLTGKNVALIKFEDQIATFIIN